MQPASAPLPPRHTEGRRKPEHVGGGGQKQAIDGGGSGGGEQEEEEEEEGRMNSCTSDLDNFPFHGDKTTISAVSRHRRPPPADFLKIGR